MRKKNGAASDYLASLHADYAQTEQLYNCLISNWDWFTSNSYRPEMLLGRIDQN